MSEVQKANALVQRHPLQRLNSPSRNLSALIHMLGLSSFAYSFYYLEAFPNPINDAYGGHMQFLTILGLSLSTLTFVLALLADLTLSRPLFRAKTLLSVTTTPLESLISLLYWSIHAIDPRLLLPDFAPPLPLHADLGFHAAPALFLALDLLLLSPPYTLAVRPSLALSGGIAAAYWVWVEQCYKQNGYYPYPLFDSLTTPWRAVLFAGSAVLMSGSLACLKWVYVRVNGRNIGGARARPGSVKRA